MPGQNGKSATQNVTGSIKMLLDQTTPCNQIISISKGTSPVALFLNFIDFAVKKNPPYLAETCLFLT